MIIGLVRERKNPPDIRVALTPVQCKSLIKRYPGTRILVEKSSTRCFSNESYLQAGVEVTENMNSCDILLGIKEIPPLYLIENKTYFFFSHTIKKQPHNKEMLKEILRKNIRLIDYETLKWEKGNRVVGFGRFAGIIGAYNGLLTMGRKCGAFNLPPAYTVKNYAEWLQEALKVSIPHWKIVLTGAGRVANGSLELLRNLRIKEVTPEAYLSQKFNYPVFVHLNSHELYKNVEGKPWDTEHFYRHHSQYKSTFQPFISKTDLLINGIFWTNDLPRLFQKEETKLLNFKIKVIADISCDVDGSVPITYQSTSITNPVIGWSISKQEPCEPYLADSIDIMAVGNLPNELPQDASEEFGEHLLQSVIPELFKKESRMLLEATIAENGMLGSYYGYLADYVNK